MIYNINTAVHIIHQKMLPCNMVSNWAILISD